MFIAEIPKSQMAECCFRHERWWKHLVKHQFVSKKVAAMKPHVQLHCRGQATMPVHFRNICLILVQCFFMPTVHFYVGDWISCEIGLVFTCSVEQYFLTECSASCMNILLFPGTVWSSARQRCQNCPPPPDTQSKVWRVYSIMLWNIWRLPKSPKNSWLPVL